jgi:hypothetical protein
MARTALEWGEAGGVEERRGRGASFVLALPPSSRSSMRRGPPVPTPPDTDDAGKPPHKGVIAHHFVTTQKGGLRLALMSRPKRRRRQPLSHATHAPRNHLLRWASLVLRRSYYTLLRIALFL